MIRVHEPGITEHVVTTNEWHVGRFAELVTAKVLLQKGVGAHNARIGVKVSGDYMSLSEAKLLKRALTAAIKEAANA